MSKNIIETYGCDFCGKEMTKEEWRKSTGFSIYKGYVKRNDACAVCSAKLNDILKSSFNKLIPFL